MKQETNRNITIDVLKGMAIILVIFAHCIQFGSGLNYLESKLFFDNYIFKFIYSFHMPLFMLISGYLFYFTIKKHSFKYNLKARFMGLLVPIIIWQTIWILLMDHHNFNKHNMLYIFNSYLNTLWFISSVFLNSLLVLFCNKYAKDSILLYAFIFIISLFIPNIFGFNLYVFMLPFFLFGYFYNKTGGIKGAKNWKFRLIGLISLVILFIVFLSHYETNDYAYTSGTSILRNHMISLSQIYTNLFRWIIGLIGSLCVILIFKLFLARNANTLFIKGMRIIGTKTMGLYIISTYLFKLFILLPINNFHYIYITIECILTIGISFLLTWLIEQNHYLRTYLLGGR